MKLWGGSKGNYIGREQGKLREGVRESIGREQVKEKMKLNREQVKL